MAKLNPLSGIGAAKALSNVSPQLGMAKSLLKKKKASAPVVDASLTTSG
ncbi:hypothetical protein [Phenylobacterium sp.]|nr:hypothetical protein [Phenylobacterium sp.]